MFARDLAQEKSQGPARAAPWMLHIAGDHRASCAKGLAPAESSPLMQNQAGS